MAAPRLRAATQCATAASLDGGTSDLVGRLRLVNAMLRRGGSCMKGGMALTASPQLRARRATTYSNRHRKGLGSRNGPSPAKRPNASSLLLILLFRPRIA